MEFSEWIKNQGIKQTFLAEKLGVTYSCLYLLTTKKTTPGLHLAIAIEDVTNGAVTCRDWPVTERNKGKRKLLKNIQEKKQDGKNVKEKKDKK